MQITVKAPKDKALINRFDGAVRELSIAIFIDMFAFSARTTHTRQIVDQVNPANPIMDQRRRFDKQQSCQNFVL